MRNRREEERPEAGDTEKETYGQETYGFKTGLASQRMGHMPCKAVVPMASKIVRSSQKNIQLSPCPATARTHTRTGIERQQPALGVLELGLHALLGECEARVQPRERLVIVVGQLQPQESNADHRNRCENNKRVEISCF